MYWPHWWVWALIIALLEINGPEMPIMDGSSQPFVELIEEAGVVEQDAAKVWYSIDENIYLLR